MARDSGTRKRSTESRVIFTALGVTVWIVAGFLVGLVAGVVSEEPELLVGHMAGRDTEIEWAAGGPDDDGTDGAGGPLAPVGAPPSAPPGSLVEDPPPSTPVLAAQEKEADEPVPPPASPAKAAAPPPRPAAADAPRFLIQVGAYDSRDSAQQVAETLRGKGYAVQVLSNADDGRFRVRVGPVVARDRAEGLARRLEDDEGLPTWILRVREG